MDREPFEQPGNGEDTILPIGGEQMPGDRIGLYRLVEQIGEGGFGVVWLAERREPMVQRTALETSLTGLREALARYEREEPRAPR